MRKPLSRTQTRGVSARHQTPTHCLCNGGPQAGAIAGDERRGARRSGAQRPGDGGPTARAFLALCARAALLWAEVVNDHTVSREGVSKNPPV